MIFVVRPIKMIYTPIPFVPPWLHTPVVPLPDPLGDDTPKILQEPATSE